MFGDEQEYFESRQAEPMNERFFTEPRESGFENFCDSNKEELPRNEMFSESRKNNFGLRNFVYPFTSIIFWVVLIFVSALTDEILRSVLPTKDLNMNTHIAAVAGSFAAVYIVFLILSVPMLNKREKTKEKLKMNIGSLIENKLPANMPEQTKRKIVRLASTPIILCILFAVLLVLLSGGGLVALIVIITVMSKFKNTKKK